MNAFPNCYLVGFMGCGKSTVGPLLAESLHFDFIDTDQWIEAKTGHSCSEIFAQKGEAHFRALEASAIEACAGTFGRVVACGGGLPLIPGMMDRLLKSGWVAWLNPSLDVLISRLQGGLEHRPLLAPFKDHLCDRVVELLEGRAPIYRRAHHVEKIGQEDPMGCALRLTNAYLQSQRGSIYF